MGILRTRVATRPAARAGALALFSTVVAAGVWWPVLAGGHPTSNSVAPPPVTAAQAFKTGANAFIENRGQWDAQALFLARSAGVDLWLTSRGVVYDFYRVEHSRKGNAFQDRQSVRGHVVRMEFVGGNASAVRGVDLLDGRHNYLLGNDRRRWATDVERYSEAKSDQIYDGVEARWYFDQGHPRYDLVIAPGVDPGKIQMRFEGADGLAANGDSLSILTSLGTVQQNRLFAYQRGPAGVTPVACRFRVQNDIATFELGEYDRSLPLTIDPIVWSTFQGGLLEDAATALAVGSGGNVFLAGNTISANFPVTAGAYDTTENDSTGSNKGDTFVSKFDGVSGGLLYATYLGGTNLDRAYSMAVDTGGSVVVVGETNSPNFPVTLGSFDRAFSGSSDGFVTKLNSTGTVLTFSSFLGGSAAGGATEPATGVAFDSSLNVVVCGQTSSDDFPTTVGAFDSTCAGIDCYVTKLAANGASLLASTLFGGTANDSTNGVAVDSSGNMLVAGLTQSTDFPTTAGAFRTTMVSGLNLDAYVVKIASNAKTLTFGTFLGSTASAAAKSIAIDASNRPVIVGTGTIPTTAGAYQTSSTTADVFVAKLSADGTSMVFGTYLGGTHNDSPSSVKLDSTDNPVIVGTTYSADFPVTGGAPQGACGGGSDAFVAKLAANGSALLYGTYLGGLQGETGTAVGIDSSGAIFAAGETQSSDYPIAGASSDLYFNGATDAFITKLSLSNLAQLSSLTGNQYSVVGGYALALTAGLSSLAPPGGAVIDLASDNPNKITGPPSVGVPSGVATKTFNIKTYTVLVPTVVAFTAKCGGVSRTVSLTLKVGGLKAFKIQASTVKGGQSAVGTIILSGVAPTGGRNISLLSTDSKVQVPATVFMAAGDDTTTFAVTTSAVTTETTVDVIAKLGLVTKKVTMTLTP